MSSIWPISRLIRSRVDVYSLQLGWSAMFWGLELSPSQITCWFPQEATDPWCPRPQPLDGKHDPSPLIFLSEGRKKKGVVVKRQEGRGEGQDTVKKRRERSKTIQASWRSCFCVNPMTLLWDVGSVRAHKHTLPLVLVLTSVTAIWKLHH